MKKIIFLFFIIAWFINSNITAQDNQEIIIKAGTKILDYFPVKTRFRYPQFTPGKVFFKDGTFIGSRLNYNILYGEMQFIRNKDTLSIANAKDIDHVCIASDTFYYDKGFIESLFNIGTTKLGLKQYVKMVDIKKQAAYGMTDSVSASDSYNSLPSSSGYYNLTVSDDISVRQEKEYYLGSKENGFQLFRKKYLLQLFPENENEIKQFLKDNPVNFNRGEDVMKLCNFLKDLKVTM